MAPPTRSATLMDKPANEIEQLITKVCSKFSDELELKLDKKFEKLSDQINNLNLSVTNLNKSTEANKSAISLLEQSTDFIQQTLKKNSLRFHGLVLDRETNFSVFICKFINDKLLVDCKLDDINYVYKSGKKNESKNFIVNFVRNEIKSQVYYAKSKLKGTGVSIYEDLTKSRYELFVKSKNKYGNKNVWTANGRIFAYSNGTKLEITSESSL